MPVINFNAGIEYYLTDQVIVRTGGFSDFSQFDELDNNISTRIRPDRLDYYGGTLSLSIVNEVDQKLFTTSFGIVYRLGIGEYRTVEFGPSGLQFDTKDWTTHELSLYFSESVAF